LVFERLCRWNWLHRLRQEDIGQVQAAMQAEVDALAAGDDSRV
jgi:hypothetical protein